MQVIRLCCLVSFCILFGCSRNKVSNTCEINKVQAETFSKKVYQIYSDYKLVPNDGFLAKEKDAIEVGKIYLNAIYGNRIRPELMTFGATLNGDVWTVTASLPRGEYLGGDASIRMSKSYGCVLDYRRQQ